MGRADPPGRGGQSARARVPPAPDPRLRAALHHADRQRLRPRRGGWGRRRRLRSARGPGPGLPGTRTRRGGPGAPSGRTGSVERPSARRARITAVRHHPGHPAERGAPGCARRQNRRRSRRRQAPRRRRRAEGVGVGTSFRGAVLGAVDAGPVPIGLTGRGVAVLLATTDHAQRGARHHTGPRGGRSRTGDPQPRSIHGVDASATSRIVCPTLSSPASWTGSAASPGADHNGLPGAPGIAAHRRQPRPAAARSGRDLGPVVVVSGRRGDVRGAALGARSRPDSTATSRVGRAALDAHRRRARYREDEADRRDRTRV